MNRDHTLLKHILECTDNITNYIGDENDPFADQKTYDATLRSLQVLAESAGMLSPEIHLRNPEIDWRALRGFRNVLVHDYLGIDKDQVLQNITAFLPLLREKVIEELRTLEA